ncbi:hypothetical protein JHK87_025068 [Glycine soja]|nr:hypothetical protein JHK87_025068 [Glycine soja]
MARPEFDNATFAITHTLFPLEKMKDQVKELKTYQDTVETADTRRGAKSALVSMAARKATSTDTTDTVDIKQENLPKHDQGGFARLRVVGQGQWQCRGWLCKVG